MYPYEYEDEVLLSLRLLKFLYDQDPDGAKELIGSSEGSVDSLMMIAESAIWWIFHDVVFEDDDEWESSIATFTHPAIDRFCTLSAKWLCRQSINSGAWLRKVQDVPEYFAYNVSHSVARAEVRYTGGHAVLWVRFSTDCYEYLTLGNALVDMLIYFQQENQRLEELLNRMDDAEQNYDERVAA